jgi:hypothetical protein
MAKAKYGYRKDGTPLNSQWATILYILQENPGMSITSWQAIKEFGFTRLSGIVKQIEYRAGIRLARKDVKHITRYGAVVYHTEYWYANNQ